LRELWDKRISTDERAALQTAMTNPVVERPVVSEMKAMDFAVQHCYERASVVTDKELLRHALRFGVGDVNVDPEELGSSHGHSRGRGHGQNHYDERGRRRN